MHAHRTSDTAQGDTARVPAQGRLLARVAAPWSRRLREAHAQRELAAALAGHHGRGVQAEVEAASQRAA